LVFILLGNYIIIAQSNATKSGNKSTPTSTAKTNVKKSPLERLKIGGNLSGGITNDFYFLSAAPRISMEVTKWFVPGVSAAYMYSQESADYKVNSHTYGAGIFTDIYPIKYVFGRIEYQHLWYNQTVKGGGEKPLKYSDKDHFLLTGVGAKLPVGGKTSVSASVLFNVLNNDKSEYYMYKNPIYSLGIEVGL